jgi:hypothetical protein
LDVLTPNWRDRSALSLRQASDLCRRVSAWCAYPNLLFGVKSRAKVGDRGGAPVSVTEKLLARIKALFEPSRAAAPPQEIEEAPSPATPVPQLAATPPPEPITHVEEPPSIEEVPTAVAEARPLVEAAPTVVLAAPPAVEPAPPVISADPTFIGEVPTEVQPLGPPGPAGGLTLRLEGDRGSRSTFEVMKSGATIGRGPESTIQLADLSVSRKHAKITYKQGAYWLSDLGSMGGTWIDGTKLAAPRRVATGQTIDIGLCRLTVVSIAAAADEKSPAAKGPSHAA